MPLGITSQNNRGFGRETEGDAQKQSWTMKRHGNLFDKICSMENLILADANARKGKSKKWGVKVFDRNKEENLKRLLKQLSDGTFRTSQYKTMVIHEPKERVIYKLPYYPDRIVHHAIMNVLEPILVGSMTTDTYANIKGRGIHACAEKVRHALYIDPEGTRYCLKIDIRKYYPSIDHEKLKTEVRRIIKDERVLALIFEIIDSGAGLPIGNYLSQYLANVMLSRFDHRIKEVHGVRYYFPLRGRHGVPFGNEGGAASHTWNIGKRACRIGVATETQLADIPRGRTRLGLPRLCVFPRLHAATEEHQEKDIQAHRPVPTRRNQQRDIREVYGLMERMDEVVRKL